MKTYKQRVELLKVYKQNIGFFVMAMFFINLCCTKEPIAIEIPDFVPFEKSEIYLNGELIPNYKPDLKYFQVDSVINYSFYDSTGIRVNVLGFAWLPLTIGTFDLHSDRILYIKALTQFSQIVGEDLKGYSYELIDANEGFLNITELDTLTRVVQGNFLAKFKRTSKNGNSDLGLPKYLLFQGVFNEKYTVE